MTINHLIPSHLSHKTGYTAKLRRTTQILSPISCRWLWHLAPVLVPLEIFGNYSKMPVRQWQGTEWGAQKIYLLLVILLGHTLFIFCFPLLSRDGCELISKTKHDYYVKWDSEELLLSQSNPHGIFISTWLPKWCSSSGNIFLRPVDWHWMGGVTELGQEPSAETACQGLIPTTPEVLTISLFFPQE